MNTLCKILPLDFMLNLKTNRCPSGYLGLESNVQSQSQLFRRYFVKKRNLTHLCVYTNLLFKLIPTQLILLKPWEHYAPRKTLSKQAYKSSAWFGNGLIMVGFPFNVFITHVRLNPNCTCRIFVILEGFNRVRHIKSHNAIWEYISSVAVNKF